eukprot:TRINITY_DN2521_c0_g1_i2.p2 TRINITY_DN2521_c0_g1~~TRINITY_DN2521_c0_g1_i2.p2  ORF type:complete len:460 (-),score=233.54 TRINITY_DN2521_c0_g1_i2:127-1506(-)
MKFAVCISACGLASQAQGSFLTAHPHGFLQVDTAAAKAAAELPDYQAQCDAILSQCKAAEKANTDDYYRNLKALEEEYKRQKRILEDKEDTHKEEVADVKAQKAVVADEKMDVVKARKVVKDNAHCPEELEEAEEELSKQEGIPNDSEKRIDDECRAKKAVLEARMCVEELRKAEKVLGEEKGEHKDSKGELRSEKGEAAAAADALPPQEQRVADALAAWEAAKRQGPPSAAETDNSCQAELDALLAELDARIRALEDEYERQLRILRAKENTHENEVEDVKDQEDEVAEEKRHVKDAKVLVEENKHCPPKLEAAKDELARQEAIPNVQPQNVYDECEATREVLKWQRCVDELREAEMTLAKEKDEHRDSKHELNGEEDEESAAKKALPPQEKKVADALAALEAARRARAALAKCGQEETAPAPAPAAESAEPAPKSGAASVTISAVAVVAAAATVFVV